jgi:hypothetical protein
MSQTNMAQSENTDEQMFNYIEDLLNDISNDEAVSFFFLPLCQAASVVIFIISQF